jgi:hypothetical protein
MCVVINRYLGFTELCLMTRSGGVQCNFRYPCTADNGVKYISTIHTTST